MPKHIVVILLAAAAATSAARVSAQSRSNAPASPNILWITAEDMSATLGCYGDKYASTPNIDALAEQSTRYSHAFATAPVCSPSRACLINGCIATTQGAHPMRSEFPLPPEMDGFPRLLRDAGYFTSNNEKTDYNSAAAQRIKTNSWDQCGANAHWRGRSDDQPFFSVFNLMTSHQSRTMVWSYEQFQNEVQTKLKPSQRHSTADAPIPPYYPNTPLIRKTVARFYDCVTVMDQQVGEILKQLDDDGLADNTIVFFYSDHGNGMPRHKRVLYDSGMHIPMLIRVPDRLRKFRPTASGNVTDRLVCFEDFAPTALRIAGLPKAPGHFRGHSFLGQPDTDQREYVFGHRDRVDEIIDLSRSVRDKRFLYIRNFMPHLGWNQQSAWIDQGEVRQDFYKLAKSGDATDAQAQYLSGSRPREELYDCVADPMNLQNLAGDPSQQQRLTQMQDALRVHLAESRDLGFIPEIDLRDLTASTTPIQWAKTNAKFLETARTAAMDVGDGIETVANWLGHTNRSARYWGCVACSAADALPKNTLDQLARLIDDPSPSVQIECANALIRHGKPKLARAKLLELLNGDDLTVLLHTARTVELLADPSYRDAMQKLFDRFEEDPTDMAWFIRFTTTGFLSRL